MSTLPHCTGTDEAPRSVSPSDGRDLRTDEGLRQALHAVQRSGSWETPDGQALLDEIRRHAIRNAAHVAAATGVAMESGLVDDVVLAAWMVLRRHGDKVLAAGRPWAYLMSSAQRNVLDEVRAQQLLTNTASIRGRAREVLPRTVRPVGSTAVDLATALRHEPSDADGGDARRIVRQVRHEQPPLIARSEPDTPPLREREQWFVAFVDLLVEHGADQAVTVAAVDRLADLFSATYVGWWEWAARRDPILAHLGLRPEQAPRSAPCSLARDGTDTTGSRTACSQPPAPRRNSPTRCGYLPISGAGSLCSQALCSIRVGRWQPYSSWQQQRGCEQ